MFEFWNLTFLQLLQSWSSAGAQWREDAQHHCWLLTAWLMSIFAGLMGSVLCGIMCLTINFSSMGHVSSVNESVTLMHAQKMTFIFTLGTERESQIVCVRGIANGTRMQSPWFVKWCMLGETSEGDLQCPFLSREEKGAFVCCLNCVHRNVSELYLMYFREQIETENEYMLVACYFWAVAAAFLEVLHNCTVSIIQPYCFE